MATMADCDDEATANAIFMANLSPVGSLNDDMVEPCYDFDIHYGVPHYDTDHDSDMLNFNIQELGYIENIVSNNESYDEHKGNSDVISYTDYMLTIGNDEDNYVPPPVQKNGMMLSVIKQMKSQVEKYNKVLKNLNKARDLLTKFDECIKRRTMLSPREIGSWEQSDVKGAFKADLKGKFSEPQRNHNGTSVNTKFYKPSTSRTKLYSITPFPKSKVIPKVVEKNDLSKSVTSHLTTNKIIEKCTKVLAVGLFNIKTEPINAYFKNNRVVHRDYLKVTNEHVVTLQELLEEARALKPFNEHIGYASKFTGRIQELRVSSTNASGSKSKSNTKNDRISQLPSRSMKNKVKARHRKFKSSANKTNHVSDCNANVRNVTLSKNSDTICLSFNECLFSANHDAYVVQYLKKMQKRKVAKSAKPKVKREYKPTRPIFKTI
ncbi:hypothetical protein Tco_1150745 [Tanacetum coccineum]